MNANELANLLEIDSWYKLVTREQIATMLRQQQAEYYSLLVNHDKLYAKVVEQQAEIKSLKAKTLTDEEILDIWYAMKDDSNNWTRYVDFARTILRKAQND
jgi:hypothetical protein